MTQREDAGVLFASKSSCYQRERYVYLPWIREDINFIKSYGKCKAFHKGRNSSCHAHVHQHNSLYKEMCKKVKIPINHWTIPHEIWKVTEEEEKEANK